MNDDDWKVLALLGWSFWCVAMLGWFFTWRAWGATLLACGRHIKQRMEEVDG